ncbi:hypothetical protein R3P38DRAFT_3246042 [Favolaschia claudopus]|uniref:Uncharacterized protein n=1 Tax=Favolaschia claudopus TaxID=2862362 RepID=A0AAV9YZV4_9AGAR
MVPLTYRRDWRSFGCRQAKARPRRIKQRIPRLLTPPSVIVFVAAAPRSGAIAMTKTYRRPLTGTSRFGCRQASPAPDA